jgi:O-antigen ligase
MMRVLLLLLVAAITLSTAFDIDPGPAPGVKIKNFLLYLIALSLILNAIVRRDFKLQLPSIPALHLVLIGYAMMSVLIIVLMLDYPRYDAVRAVFMVKNILIDNMFFFMVFFYGPKSDEDALLVLKGLLAAWAFSHAIAVLDAFGVVHVGDVELRGDGRVQGTIGESNQYGAFAAVSVPPMIALAFATRNVLLRLFWIGAATCSAAALVMTVSRGAYVATVLAAIAGFFMFRRYVPTRKLLMFSIGGVFVAVLVVVLVAALGYKDLLLSRLVGEAHGTDMESISSGRTAIWWHAIEVMLRNPITLVTGYGWNSYISMPFRYLTHNFYLYQWFNLGLVGLTATVLVLYQSIRVAYRSVPFAPSEEVRNALIAYVLGGIAYAVSNFFVEVFVPWLFFWAYTGLAARLAVNALERAPAVVPIAARSSTAQQSLSDPFGWRAAPR